MSPEDKLLTCKAVFIETVSRHHEASKTLTVANQKAQALQAALDQALALAVLDDAQSEVGVPEVRHKQRAGDKRQRQAILDYCRRIVSQYVDLQSRTRPLYLLGLKPSAQAILDKLQQPELE